MFWLLTALLIAPSSQAALKLGDTLPAKTVSMMSTKGSATTLAEVANGKKGTLVIFSCNHCPYAKAWESRIASIGTQAQAKGLGVVMVNSNDPTDHPEDSLAGMKTKFYTFPYVVDETSDVAKTFGATKTPDIFLFDANEKLVYKGAVDDNSESATDVKKHYLKDAIASLVAGRTIATAETKAIGCGIKFRK